MTQSNRSLWSMFFLHHPSLTQSSLWFGSARARKESDGLLLLFSCGFLHIDHVSAPPHTVLLHTTTISCRTQPKKQVYTHRKLPSVVEMLIWRRTPPTHVRTGETFLTNLKHSAIEPFKYCSLSVRVCDLVNRPKKVTRRTLFSEPDLCRRCKSKE